jgi:hypothetical protein
VQGFDANGIVMAPLAAADAKRLKAVQELEMVMHPSSNRQSQRHCCTQQEEVGRREGAMVGIVTKTTA